MDGRDKINVIAVVGPTASGKTALGIELAKRLGGEIVSCDSMQVYKGMDIASAKPTEAELRSIPHHMISYVNPNETYSVARFCNDASAEIGEIAARGKTPILVGGTGLYVNSLLDGINFIHEETNSDLRKNLFKRAEAKGAESLLDELGKIDPEYAEKLHVNDVKRIVRALELYYSSGITMSEQLENSRVRGTVYDPIMIGITYADRAKLYERINLRVDYMVESGLVEEARSVYESDFATAAQAIGHKELFGYLSGVSSLDECIEHLKMQTRRYAKRQLSWFRRDSRINWIYADSVPNVADEAMKIICERSGA